MSVSLRCVLPNNAENADLVFSEKLRAVFGDGLEYSRLESSRLYGYENWISNSVTIDLNRSVVVVSPPIEWRDFCTEPLERYPILCKIKSLAEILSSKKFLFAPETSDLCVTVSKGWDWERMQEELHRQYGPPLTKSSFFRFERRDFGETSDEVDLLDGYFSLNESEFEKVLEHTAKIRGAIGGSEFELYSP